MTTARVHRDVPWTTQQRQAIETRDVSVSLSAGAGCGKTYVLTERYLSYFRAGDERALQPDDLHHLVAITFTERAAREMRDRIRHQCYDQLRHAKPEAVAYWSNIVRGLDGARISTIHSFCATLLRTYAVEAGLDPQFEVLEQAQSETLLSEAVDDTLRRLVAQRDRATMELGARFDLVGVRSMARVLAIEAPGAALARWLDIGVAEQVVRWTAYFDVRVVPAVVRRIATSPAVRAVESILREHEPTHPKMQARRAVLLESLPALGADPPSGEELAALFGTIREHAKVQGGGTAKHWANEEVYGAFRDAAGDLRGMIDGALRMLSYDPAAAVEAAEVGHQLLAVAAEVADRYSRRKQELAVLDFDDLLRRARDLLVDPRHAHVRERLAAQIHLLLVDEFQDTDRVQVELVQALCGEAVASGKLFFVGDYKQSIYRFRGAEPDVFRRLRHATPARGRLSLTENFRSQPAILEFVNGLFWHELGGDYEPLRAHRPQSTPRPAVEFLWAGAPAGTAKEDVRSVRRREAEWIAARIAAMLDGGEPLVGESSAAHPGHEQGRAARPGDIAILFRALSDVELYEDALRRQGIDYYLVGGHAFYAQQEIFDLLNLLRTVTSPSDGVSLAGVLRSGFFALTDETLFWLAQHPDGLTAGLFATDLPAEIVDDQRPRVASAAATIARLRGCKDGLRICELIELAMSLTGYDAVLLAEFLGDRKLANLRKVIEQARSFERAGTFGLTDFIAELAEFVVRQPKEPLAATFSEDTDVVRLMTIHQAKGLEFPIVIVPDLGRSTEHRAGRVHFDEQLGPLVQLSEDADGRRAVAGYELWRFLEQDEDLAEIYRLLYVATTRAADYLLLSSGVTTLGDADGTWMQLLARRFDLLGGMLVGEIPPGEARPQVRVTTEKPTARKNSATRGPRVDWDRLLADAEKARPEPDAALRAVDPVPVDLGARRQYSFSRLTGGLYRPSAPGDEAALSLPAIDDAARTTALPPADLTDPRALGTLVHSVLAAIDFAAPDAWQERVPREAERQLIGSASAEVLEASRLVERFLASPRAGELARARHALAEAEFLLAWPPGGDADAGPLITGYIDRLYQDTAGHWHVLDFKTNRVSADNVARVAARYEMQMLVYALAVEQTLGAAPASLTLHFLRTGDEHSFTWNDAARRRAIEQVDAAITAAAAAESDAGLGRSAYPSGNAAL